MYNFLIYRDPSAHDPIDCMIDIEPRFSGFANVLIVLILNSDYCRAVYITRIVLIIAY